MAAAPHSTRELVTETLDISRRAWKPLLFTALLYRGVSFLLLWPIAGMTLQLAIASSGQQVVTEEDLPRILLSPVGLLGFLLTGGVAITILALEQACHLVVALSAEQEQPLSSMSALHFSLLRSGRILSGVVRILVWCVCLSLPFLAIGGLTYLWLLTEHDINFYLSERPPEFLWALFIGGVLSLGMAVTLIPRALGWLCALPLLLFQNISAREALTQSSAMMLGGRGSAFRVLVLWGLASLLLASINLSAIALTGTVLVPLFRNSLAALTILLGMLVLLLSIGNLIVSLAQSSVFGVAVAVLYWKRSGMPAESGELTKAATEKTSPRITPQRLLVGTLAAALAATAMGAYLLNRVNLDEEVIVIAHRGAAGTAPENTMASVRQALTDQADVVEIDVQETADGEVVVIHDSDLMKVAGVDLKIWDATMDALSDIDIGSYFDETFSDERVPALSDVLRECRGKAIVDIELKYYGHEVQLEERVAAIVEEAKMQNEVILMSLKYSAVRRMKELRPEWTVGLLTATALGDLTTREADFLAVNAGIFNSRLVRRAHAAGMKVYVWTVNDAVDVSRFASLGADGVITDFPRRAREVLDQRDAMLPIERALLDLAFQLGLAPEFKTDDSPSAQESGVVD